LKILRRFKRLNFREVKQKRMLRLGPDFVLRRVPVLKYHRAATFVPALCLFPCVTFVGLRDFGLERLKIYVALPDAKAERTGYLRIRRIRGGSVPVTWVNKFNWCAGLCRLRERTTMSAAYTPTPASPRGERHE
jgi:hypothetical protein